MHRGKIREEEGEGEREEEEEWEQEKRGVSFFFPANLLPP